MPLEAMPLAIMPLAAIIVAAGRGARAGEGPPKQYRMLGAKPVLSWTINALAAHADVVRIVTVIREDARAMYDSAAAGSDAGPRLGAPAIGGDSRQASVRAGLEMLEREGPEGGGRWRHVLIHDAARPFLPVGVIDAALRALARDDTLAGACPVLPVADTLRRGEEGCCGELVARDGLWRAQTPQCFRFDLILEAHRRFENSEFTDDAELARAAGLKVALTAGAEATAKITEAADFGWAERIADEWGAPSGLSKEAPPQTETRAGTGFDAHRFGENADGGVDHVMLCGLRIPHETGLTGHSDADVGLHALTDAVLGAACLGDIGAHFPPSEPEWRGAASHQFLSKAVEMARKAGGELRHLDVTLICERPKIRPHVAPMRQRIAEITGLDVGRVSVKATTTEGMGFAGRCEGIAAMASATLAFPLLPPQGMKK